MLLSEAFPRNPNPVMRIKESLGIDSLEDLQEKLKDPNFEYRALKVRGVGPMFLQKVKNYSISGEVITKPSQKVKTFRSGYLANLEEEVNKWIEEQSPNIISMHFKVIIPAIKESKDKYHFLLVHYKP